VKKITVTAIVLAALVGIAYVLSLLAVRPMSTDLSTLGQGKPSLVLVYENFAPSSGEALDRLKQVRADYEPRMTFIVADLGTPDGQAFANRYGLSEGQALFVRPDGEPLRATTIPAAEQELRDRLDQQLTMME
jgi:hypothetical protein